jgi:hypothetical protein
MQATGNPVPLKQTKFQRPVSGLKWFCKRIVFIHFCYSIKQSCHRTLEQTYYFINDWEVFIIEG